MERFGLLNESEQNAELRRRLAIRFRGYFRRFDVKGNPFQQMSILEEALKLVRELSNWGVISSHSNYWLHEAIRRKEEALMIEWGNHYAKLKGMYPQNRKAEKKEGI